MKKGNKKLGFTLIELLLVIAIIGILVFVTSSSFITSQQKSRDASRKSELNSLAGALNMYFADKGYFPEESYMSGKISGQGEFSEDGIVYMKKVPKGDASGMKAMRYEVSSTGKSFRLYTNLENTEDGGCSGDVTECNGWGYAITSGCCYIVTSSNIGTTGTLE